MKTIAIDKLLDNQELILIRRSNKKKAETFNECDILREDAIISKDVPGLSMNLLGSKYKIKFIKYVPKIKTKAVEVWDGQEHIYLSDFFRCYSVLNNYSGIFFNASDLHNKIIPYNERENAGILKALKKLSLKYDITNGEISSKGKALIKHVPTCLNYWHVELKLLDFNGNEITKVGNQFNTHIATYMLLQYLRVKSFANPGLFFPSISKGYYKKTT